MKIKLFACLDEGPLVVSVSDMVITINGEALDLSVIPEGYRIPGSAVDNKWISGADYIENINGIVYLTLRFPVMSDSPESVKNPATPIVIDINEGDVVFPDISPDIEVLQNDGFE